MEKQVETEKNYNVELHKFYSMIIQVNFMDQLTKEGWKIIRKRQKDNNILENDKLVSIISVIGNKNSGKSFILHLMTNKNIPNGYTVTTEGLSFVVPDKEENKDDNYILIDTAGTESPLLCNNTDELTIEKKNKMAKDRQITDYFLQKFILEKSDIFICVVDNLTLTNQKFINRIIKNYSNKKIYIIHNLKTFIEKEQVENYIKDTLMESVTFHLEQDQYYYFEEEKTAENIEKENQIFFKQKLKGNEYKENNRVIIHLIIANEESEAGKYYNNSTINYLNQQLRQVKEKKEFKIIENLKDFLVSFSGEIFNTELKEESIKIENDCIKVVDQNLELKDCLMDELGNNIIADTNYKPKYRCGYFTENDEKKFFVEIELFGIWELSQRIEIKENFFYIYIKGKKKEKDKKDEEKKYELKNFIPNDNFNLVIKVENCKGIVKDEPKTEEDNGLYILLFSLREKYIEEDVVSEESIEEFEDE